MPTKTQYGLTLIELLVTLMLGIMIVGTATSLYLTAARSHALETSVLEPTDNAALAIALISQDLRQAGRPPVITSLPTSAEPSSIRCETSNTWIARTDLSVFAINDPENNTHAFNRCLTLDSSARADVIAIWTTAITRDNSEPVTFIFYLDQGPQPPPGSSCVPASSLYRTVQQLNKRPYREEIVAGIEVFQLMFGLDSDNDGSVDGYYPADRIAQWASVVSVRIDVIARSSCASINFHDTATYQAGEHTVRPDDQFRRVALSTIVSLRNHARFLPESSHATSTP